MRLVFLLRSTRLLVTLALLLTAADAPAVRASHGEAASAGPALPTDEGAIIHLLNRVTFGAAERDIDAMRRLGVATYLDQQLHPEQIRDAQMDARLARFETLTMSSRELADRFFIPALMERHERQRQQAAGANDGTQGQMPEGAQRRPAGEPRDGNAPRPRMSEAQRGERRVLAELAEQKLLRAIYSERQLQEVLVDFWFNHFNVFAGKGIARLYLTEYERDAIRPHVLGRFRDLLGAVAQSPAMLFYLDNWMSADPAGDDPMRLLRDREPNRAASRGRGPRGRSLLPRPPGRQEAAGPRAGQQRARTGLNENYARELLELHTLGVDGGYTQKDVIEVARAFTGWTIDTPRRGGAFRFERRIHDDGQKVVLGQVIEAGGGKSDGDRVLDLLARHPSTARLIATKLARRFVSDEPPAALVDRAAARFRETGGDLREVVRTIVTSPELFAPEAYRAKVKTPLELVVSAVRVTGARVETALSLVQALRGMGMAPYFAQPPTGYADRADAWVNTGALLSRMNFAVALVGNELGGVTVDLGALASTGSPDRARARLIDAILQNQVSSATRQTLEKATEIGQLAALTIGAPEFQRR